MINKEVLIHIGYKSGQHVEMWFNDLSVFGNGGGIIKVEWKMAKGRTARPLSFGVDNVESIFILKARYRIGPFKWTY